MRVIFGLLTLAVATQAVTDTINHALTYQPGKQYRYDYRALSTTGVPLGSNDRTGLVLWTQVMLFFQTDNTVFLQMENPVLRELNYDTPAALWQEGHIPDLDDFPEFFTRLPQEVDTLAVQQLSRPIGFTLGFDGIVRDIKVAQDEPEWILNIKKAVVNQLQIQRVEEAEQKTEDTIVGADCKVNYDIVKVNENTQEITKDFNINMCDRLSRFRTIIGANGVLIDENEDIISTSFVNKLETEKNNNRFFVKKSVTEGRFTVRPYSTENGEVVTYTRQELVFVNQVPTTVRAPTNIVKRYSTLFAELIDRQNPIRDVYSYGHLLSESQTITLIKKDLGRVVEQISREDQWMPEEKTDLLMQLIHLLRGLQNEDSFVELVNFALRPQNEPKMRPVLVSALAHCGSPALVKDLPALKEKLTTAELKMIITAIPSTHMPTLETVQILKDLYTKTNDPSVKEQTILTLGSLVNGICRKYHLGEIKPSQECSTTFKSTMTKFFSQQYTLCKDDIERLVVLRAIGNSGLDYTTFLQTLIFDETLTTEIRESAIVAMRRSENVDDMVKVLLPVFRNQEQKFTSELRIVTFSTLMERLPTAEMLVKLTARFNEETCRQVGNYVYSYVRNLIELPTILEPTKELISAAQNILPTIQRFEDGTMYSRNMKFLLASLSRRMAKLINVDLMHVHTQFMPRALNFKLWDFFTGYYANCLEAGLRFEGLDKIVQQLFEMIYQGTDSSDYLTTIMSDRYRRDLSHIQNLLREDEIVDRPIEQTRGFMFLRFLGNEIGIFHTERYSLQQLESTLSEITSLRDVVRVFNVMPVMPTMMTKIQSLVGMPFVAHYKVMAVFDIKSERLNQQETTTFARTFVPRLFLQMSCRTGTDMGIFKSLVGNNVHLKTVLPLNILVTRENGQIGAEIFINKDEKLIDETLFEMVADPIVQRTSLNLAHLSIETQKRQMVLPMVDNIVNIEQDFGGVKMTLQTNQEGYTFRRPLFPLCARHALRVQFINLRLVKEFGLKTLINYDMTNYKYGMQLFWNPRLQSQSQQLDLTVQLTKKNQINLPMLTLEIDPKWTSKVFKYFVTLEKKSGKINPAYSWIEAGEENPIELIFRGQFGENIRYDPKREDLVIKTTLGKSDLQKDLEFLDVETETSDCYKCEKNEKSWRNVYCDRCIYKRSWLSQINLKMFLNKEKTYEVPELVKAFVYQWATPYLNMWESEYNSDIQIEDLITSSEHQLVQHCMTHLVSQTQHVSRHRLSDNVKTIQVTYDVHPYWTEKNMTIWTGNNKIVLSRIPLIPAWRRLDNLRQNRFTDVATDRVFLPNYGTCSLDGMNQLQTLDTLIEKVPQIENCEQLLLKDCTKERRFEITTWLQNQKRFLKVLVKEMLLEIHPTGNTYQVLINNKQHQFVNNRIETPMFLITLEKVMTPQKTEETKVIVILKTEMIKCTVFGDLVNVQPPFWMKDQVCGLCGDFNGEVVRDLKLPNKTPAESLQQFIQSYTDRNCAQVSTQMRHRRH